MITRNYLMPLIKHEGAVSEARFAFIRMNREHVKKLLSMQTVFNTLFESTPYLHKMSYHVSFLSVILLKSLPHENWENTLNPDSEASIETAASWFPDSSTIAAHIGCQYQLYDGDDASTLSMVDRETMEDMWVMNFHKLVDSLLQI